MHANTPSPEPSRVRFRVLAFISSLSLLTYLDRVCISRVRGDIEKDLGFQTWEMGLVFGAFAIGYGLFEVPAGWMGDRWGSRRVLTRIVLWWSLFTALTGAVGWFGWVRDYQLNLAGEVSILFLAMVVIRFLFGCGEAGAYPNLTRIVGSWFPYRERAVAQGCVWTCARLGGFLAPIVIGRLATQVGWQRAFLVLGLLGVVWCLFFYIRFRDTPEEVPACNEAERQHIHEDRLGRESAVPAHSSLPWKTMLQQPTLWALCWASVFVNLSWYFFPTWQPRYYEDVFKLKESDTEILIGLPFLAGALGSLMGGRLSDWLVRGHGSRRWGRSLVGLAGYGGAGLVLLSVGLAREPWQGTALLCLAFLINDLALPVIWAACTDISGRFAGTVSATMNTAGCIGAFLSPALTGIILGEVKDKAVLQDLWPKIFAFYGSAGILAGLAWLFIDASKTIVHEENKNTMNGIMNDE